MSEEIFREAIIRLVKTAVTLLGVFVISFAILGYRFSENGRYQQYDQQKDGASWGNSRSESTPGMFDTRTGRRINVAH